MALQAWTRLTGVAAPPGVELTTRNGGGDPPVEPAEVGSSCGPHDEDPDPIGGPAAGVPALEVVQVLSAGVDGVLDRLLADVTLADVTLCDVTLCDVTLCDGRGLHEASTAELPWIWGRPPGATWEPASRWRTSSGGRPGGDPQPAGTTVSSPGLRSAD